MLGAIIGDIVGSRFEFNNHKNKEFDLFTDECHITDDTIMTLAVAKAIMETEKIIKPIFGKNNCGEKYYKVIKKMTTTYMQKIGRKYPNCGYGKMFSKWIFSNNPQPYYSFGNGAAMRISPAGFASISKSGASRLSKAITEVTHNHREGIKGAEATAIAIYMARRGFLKCEIKNEIINNYYPLDFTISEIRDSYQFNETCQDTVPQAIEAFLESTSFEDAIRNAISIGGDSDTLAAITGAIAEAYYGIPDKIKEKALSYLDDELLSIFDDWSKFLGNDVSVSKFHILTKYVGKLSYKVYLRYLIFNTIDEHTNMDMDYRLYIKLNELVDTFIEEFSAFANTHPEYHLKDYNLILESKGIEWNEKAIKNANIDILDEKGILALIMGIIIANKICDGILLKYFEDGYVLKWLKRLKAIDVGNYMTSIDEIYFEIDIGEWKNTYRVTFSNNSAGLVKKLCGHFTFKRKYTSEEAMILHENFKKLHVENWNSEYVGKFPDDGTTWVLAVKFGGYRGTVWMGSNCYPRNWNDLIALFGMKKSVSVINIKRVVLSLEYTKSYTVKKDVEVKNKYLETWIIDNEKNQLIIKQSNDEDYAITHEYRERFHVDDILSMMENCFESDGWVDTEKPSDLLGQYFYNIEAQYYNGALVSHSGIYNRCNIPEDKWHDLIDEVKKFINFYKFSKILDMDLFLNAGKEGEVKYCSVLFIEGGKSLYYQTNDKSIKNGDYVIVPFGAANIERVGKVVKTQFYPIDKVPFPLERTKKIIRKKYN